MQKTIISHHCAHPTPGRAKDSATQEEYLLAKFLYNTIDDTYECPQGETLKTTGRWHKKRTHRAKWIPIKKYRTPACKACPVKHLSRTGGRE
jgi:hypothetical protein